MRKIVLGLLLAALGTEAQSAPCYVGSAEAITIDAWNIEVVSEATHRIALTLTSHMKQPVRMVKVETGFLDPFGDFIGAFQFEPDFSIAPGETVEYSREIGAMVMPRLPSIAKEDADPFFCTMEVLYEDGTKEEFTE